MREVITLEKLDDKIANGELEYLARCSKSPTRALDEIRSLVQSHHDGLPRPDKKKLRALRKALGDILSDEASLNALSSSISTAHFFGTSPEFYDPEKELPEVLRQLQRSCGADKRECRGRPTGGTWDLEWILIVRIWANFIGAPLKVTDNEDDPFIKTLMILFPDISNEAAKDILKKHFPAGREKKGE